MLQRLIIFCILFHAIFGRERPNFVIILTDDQDVVLGGLSPMSRTRKLISDEGVTFENAYTTSPICCPSRSSILTGLYAHNHKTVNNSMSGNCSSRTWQKNFEPKTFGSLLHASGYRTFYSGKYLNQYGHEKSGGPKHVPEGWDWWLGLVGNSVYYNYTLSVNGSGVFRGCGEHDYLTDVLGYYAGEFLKSLAQPFLMVVSTPSPHEPFTPAVRHRGIFHGWKAPRTPNFNRAAPDKHWILRVPPAVLPSETVAEIDMIFRSRWESLLAVDELVEDIISTLKRGKVLDNTYVIYTSDNGFHMGQFGLPWDKRQPYETDIKIPLLMTGPQIPKNRTVSHPVLNIDLAPTVLELAEVKPVHRMDGKSFLRSINDVPKSAPRRDFLIEYHGEGRDGSDSECYHDPNVKLCLRHAACKCFDSRNNTFRCLRRFQDNVNELYCKFLDGENYEESYDLTRDPYQMNNLADDHIRGSAMQEIVECSQRIIASGFVIDDCFIT